jgi:hypothetical protein
VAAGPARRAPEDRLHLPPPTLELHRKRRIDWPGRGGFAQLGHHALGLLHVEHYGRWVWANCWSEAVGLGTTVLAAAALAPHFEGAGALNLLLGALVAVMLGALLEGALVGAAQERTLRARLDWPRPGAWTVATVIGAGVAWALGMLPSTILGLMAPGSPAPAVEEPQLGVLATLGLAAGLGALAGPVLGAAQWTVLKRHTRNGGQWLWANALAWAVGMPILFAGMDRVPWGGSPVPRALAVYTSCALVGAAVGMVHGAVLVRLMGPRLSLVEPRRAA